MSGSEKRALAKHYLDRAIAEGGGRAAKVEAYKPLIEARLAAYPALLGGPARPRGAGGGLRGRLHAAARVVKTIRPKLTEEPVVRFETPPGKQAQVDFDKIRLPWGMRNCPLAVLSYSRLLWTTFYRRQDMRALFLVWRARSCSSAG